MEVFETIVFALPIPLIVPTGYSPRGSEARQYGQTQISLCLFLSACKAGALKDEIRPGGWKPHPGQGHFAPHPPVTRGFCLTAHPTDTTTRV